MKNAAAVLMGFIITITGLFNSTVQAAFVKVEDFESYSLGGVAGYDLNGTPIAGSSNPASLWRTNDNSQYTVTTDSSGGSAKVLNASGNSTSDVATLPAMPDIANNTTATVYFRLKVLNTTSTAGYNRRLGPSGPPASPLTTANPTTGLYLSGSDFKAQDSSNPVSFIDANCWWSFWVIVNNSANTYTLYYQREDGGVQTLMTSNEGFSGTLAGSSDPLTDFYLFRWVGPSFYLDDIYIDTSGVNLTTPEIPEIPIQVIRIVGAESPTVHSPGDAITVTVSFPETVTLSQAGGAKLQLNIEDSLIDAVQTGPLTGTSLTFNATAPAITTMSVKVAANSLQLLNGATLRDSNSVNVDLQHGEVPLPNDQISVERLSVYPPVPGLTPSPRYSFRVRQVGSDSWMTPFAWFTECKPWTGVDDKYYSDFIGGWSNTYCNFEMANNVPVEVEITKLDPSTGTPAPIQKAVPHPRRKVKSWRIENGKAYVIFDKPVLFAVDIDGQMDEHVAPRLFDSVWSDWPFPYLNEKALHTVTIFANPFILDKPDPMGSGVQRVYPGDAMPDPNGPWTMLYFMPGVHKMFPGDRWDDGSKYYDYRIRSNKSYYIPGDAIVYGNMNNRFDTNDGKNIRVFGHGTLSGAKTLHADDMVPPMADGGKRTRTLQIEGGENSRFEGLTFADSPGHTSKILASFNADPADFNYIRWCKVFSWRANGDGITVTGSSYLEDCFLRHQDDGSYVRGLGIRRNVYWTDANGSPLRCSFIGSDRGADYPASLPQTLVVEDIDIIYGRRAFWDDSTRAAISLPDFGSNDGNTASHVVFRNINYEDPLPMRKLFGFDTTGTSGDLAGVRFENIRAAAPSVFGNTDTFMGDPNSHIRNLTFDNVILAGQHYDSLDDFTRNSYVHDFVFANTAPQTMTYQNTSGYGKWYMNDDWDSGIEPANNDIVNHTAVAEMLTVDAPAYAGTLNIAHAGTAIVSIETGGQLTVANGISLGASGRGEIDLLEGSLKLKNSSGGALSVVNGNIHIENGVLLWAGNHVSAVASLYAGRQLSFAEGQGGKLSSSATLIAQIGISSLYADYNNATSGYTTVWVTDSRRISRIKIQAENYSAMSGIGTQTTTDVGGGSNLSNIETGDWARYTVTIPATGQYQVDFRVASSNNNGGTINMVVGGSMIASAAVLKTGGWQTWTTVRTTATFDTAGTQTLQLTFVGGTGSLYSINWFEMNLPFLTSDFNIDGKVDLVDFEWLSTDWKNGYDMMDLVKMAEVWLMKTN
jgi:hypothetical protein